MLMKSTVINAIAKFGDIGSMEAQTMVRSGPQTAKYGLLCLSARKPEMGCPMMCVKPKSPLSIPA